MSEESLRKRTASRKITMAARGNPFLRGPITEEEKKNLSARSKAMFDADPSLREKSRALMTSLALSKKGQKQSPEQIAKRIASWKKTYVANKAAGHVRPRGMKYKPWDPEKKKRFRECMRARFADKKLKRKIICEQCGAEKIKQTMTQIKKQEHHFCSQMCYIKNLKENATRESGKRGRLSKPYLNWRRRILYRDKNTCRNCGAGKDKSKLHAHHILGYAGFPQFRFDDWNGKTLCRRCHALVHRKHELRSKTESWRAL